MNQPVDPNAPWPFPTGDAPKALDPTLAWPFPTGHATKGAVLGTPATIFARIVILALSLREASYDHVASDAAQAEFHAKQAAAPEKNFFGPDYARFYRQSLTACCWVAADKFSQSDLAQPAYLLLLSCSNDAMEWAEALTKATFAKLPYDEDAFKNVPPRWRTYGETEESSEAE